MGARRATTEDMDPKATEPPQQTAARGGRATRRRPAHRTLKALKPEDAIHDLRRWSQGQAEELDGVGETFGVDLLETSAHGGVGEQLAALFPEGAVPGGRPGGDGG